MIALLLIALQAAPQEQTPKFEMIASMTLRTKLLDSADLQLAQRYASCLVAPHFPMPDEQAAKQASCRGLPELRRPSSELLRVLETLDTIAQAHPGSEASLSVIKDGDASDH